MTVAFIANSAHLPFMANSFDLALPTPDDIEAARKAVLGLDSLSRPSKVELLATKRGRQTKVTIPRAAFALLREVLAQLAQGNAITVVPVHAQLTTQQAADILNVSRPHLIKLLEAGEISYHRVGSHRRVRFEDLMAYRRHQRAATAEALDELAAESQRLGLGY